VKHNIGIVGTVVLGVSFLFACSDSASETGAGGTDLTTYVAALSVNGDGSDEVSSTELPEDASSEPLAARGCGFGEIVERVVARYDGDGSGDLDAGEKAELVAEFGDPESGVSARHPNRGQPTRAAVLLNAYDSDDSGSLEASELATLQADIQARCEERLAKLVEQFDANGDGTLDDAEWEAARAALRERIAAHRRQRFAEFDTNGDGILDAEERLALRQAVIDRRAEVEGEFDVDADGQLDAEEREALQEHVRACVKTDLPMDSIERVIERRGQGRPDATGSGARPEADGEDPSADGEEPSADEPVETPAESETDDDSSDSDSSETAP
jgi:Ca2+-binding EF-hand superfamily protein